MNMHNVLTYYNKIPNHEYTNVSHYYACPVQLFLGQENSGQKKVQSQIIESLSQDGRKPRVEKSLLNTKIYQFLVGLFL